MIRSVHRLVLIAAIVLVTAGLQQPVAQAERGTGESLALTSSSQYLENGFAWATRQALDWVQTGKDPSYLPSYWAGLTNRPAFYSRDLAHQMLGAHLLGLDEENLAMLRTFAASATEARRWYPLWAFHFDGRIYELDYRGDDNFVREIPAVFELVERGYQQYLWTGDRTLVEDPTLSTYYGTAVNEFVTAHDDNANTIADEDGTGRIFLGVASYNENREGLLEAGDGVGAQYQALLAYSGILAARGDRAGAVDAAGRAGALKELFNETWWSQETGRYIRGITTAGPRTDFGKENSWFMPMKLITAPGARTDAYLRFVDESVRALPPFNIEAYTYLPETFFPYGHDETAWHWLRYLIDSRAAYPEVSYTVVSHTVQGLLGVTPNAPARRVTTLSHLPTDVDWLRVEHIPVGRHQIAVRHDGKHSSTLTNQEGRGPLVWQAQFPGRHRMLMVDGSPRPARMVIVNGRQISQVSVPVRPGQTRTASLPFGHG